MATQGKMPRLMRSSAPVEISQTCSQRAEAVGRREKCLQQVSTTFAASTLPSHLLPFEFACNKTTPTAENIGEPQQRREVTNMGSADVMAWLAEGYLAGDPIRYPLYVGSMFLAMPFQLIGVILGHPF
ncbi:hypothetical protein GCM10020255_047440 [Rhodococcus baikonurensis]